MKHILLGAFIVTSSLSFSQQKVIDSLERIINNYKNPDTTYVNLRSLCANRKIYTTPKDTTLLAYNFKTLEVAKQINYPKGEVLAYQKIGTIYQYFLSNPYRAIENYQKANTVIDANPKLKRYAIVNLGNIGNIYYNQQEYKKALSYYKKMLAFDVQKGQTYNFIANAYGKTEKLDSAIYYYKKSIKNAEKINNYTLIANSQSNLSDILNQQGKTSEAVAYIEKSLNLINAHNLGLIKAPSKATAASIYLKNLDFEKAENHALEALELNKLVGNLYTEQSAYKALSEVYTARKKYDKALDAYKNFALLNDSISSESRRIEVSRQEIQYQADKDQAIAQAEIERQKLVKNTSLIGGSGLVLASIIGFILYRRKQTALGKTKDAEFKAKVSDTELKALRAQMNPHFIFNSLNSIGDYILKNDTKSANAYLSEFAKLMRQTLENSEKKDVLLSEDLNFLKTYLDMENKRFDNKFTYEINIDKAIDIDNTLIPPFILQPFIENSVKHGLNSQNTKGHIIIEAQKNRNMIIYSVEDNGIGINTSVFNKAELNRESLGMKITKNRIDIINQLKKTDGSVKLIDIEKGLRIEVSLPLDLAF